MGFQDDITRLVKKPPADPRLADAASPEAMRAKTGLERVQRGGATINTEEVTVTSTDGIFTFVVRVVVA